MNRKLLFLALIAVMCLLAIMPFVINAISSPFNSVINREFLNGSKEKRSVLAAARTGLISIQKDIGQDPDSFGITEKSKFPKTLGNPYKVYTLVYDFKETYKEGTILSSYLSDEYTWEVPLLNGKRIVMSQTIAFFDGKWQQVVAGGGPYPGSAFCSSKSNIINLLNEHKIKTLKDFRCIAFGGLYLFYLNTNDGEFIIPLGKDVHFADITPNMVYSVSEFIRIAKLR